MPTSASYDKIKLIIICLLIYKSLKGTLNKTETAAGGRTDIRDIFDTADDMTDDYSGEFHTEISTTGLFNKRAFFVRNTAIADQYMEADPSRVTVVPGNESDDDHESSEGEGYKIL